MKLTEIDIKRVIKNIEHFKIGKKTVICLITLENGFEIVGTASCIDVNNFEYDTGKELSYRDAENKIWAYEGYMAQYKFIKENEIKLANSLDKKKDE